MAPMQSSPPELLHPSSTPRLKIYINMAKYNSEATTPQKGKDTATKPTPSKVIKSASKKANGSGQRLKLKLKARENAEQNEQTTASSSTATTTTTTITTTTATATTTATTTTTTTTNPTPQTLSTPEDSSGDETETDPETVLALPAVPLTGLPQDEQVYGAARVLYKMANAKE